MTRAPIAALLGAALLAACQTTPERPAPTRQIREAEAAVARAELAAGRTSPEVKIARDKLSVARKAVQDQHMVLAERAAAQAQADAELAIARFEADRARAAVNK